MEQELKTLRKRIERSRYLRSLENKYPHLGDLSLELISPSHCFGQLERICQELQQLETLNDIDHVTAILIKSKAAFSYFWAMTELGGHGEYQQRGEWQTKFAEKSIDIALRASWYSVADKHKQISAVVHENKGRMPGMFLLGMGKLGGQDLNFSSDVDMIGYFDPDLLPVPEVIGKSYVCHQVLQTLTQILGQKGGADFIWRVDWRLRPNASATTLAMSTNAATDYYYYRASPWHRLALMKARVVAGDASAGSVFMNQITPFVWRQNLDFRALDELGEIKNRINLEHPGLKAERLWREPIVEDISGFNVKLGSGGIREIEFVANALQLVWGGKHYRLRNANTVDALHHLSELELLDQEVAAQLADCYRFLRGLENGLQLMANLQTHQVPVEERAQQDLMVLLNIDSWREFVSQLNSRRKIVSEHFEKLFAEQAEADLGDVIWPKNLSAPAVEIVEAWEAGFINYGVSNRLRARLKPLASAIASYLHTAAEGRHAEIDVSEIVRRLHKFFRSLPQGEQYFRLLAGSPSLLESIIPPLLYSPAMSILLKQSPHIVDMFVGENRQGIVSQPFNSEFVTQADQYEIRLERSRRFVNENLYRLYLRFMQGELQVAEFQQRLSQLAEHTLDLCLRIVADNMELDEPPIAVLGMGKVGMSCMAPMSDLDLIFIFDPERHSLELASRFVARLQTAISAPMREGIVYELDTRLRPSGKSGAPTLSYDSFAAHQLNRAHTWEHIALVPSRVVSGHPSLVTRINAIKSQIMRKARDQNQLKMDAASMWARITQHRVKEVDQDIMFSKLREGGLMQSEYFASCLILAETSLCDSLDFADMLKTSAENSGFSGLDQAIEFWRIQQLWERLLGFSEQPLGMLPQEYQARLLEQSGVSSLAELLSKKQRFSKMVVDSMNAWLDLSDDDKSRLPSWQEGPVKWLS